jgi:hypothetical protein
VARACVKQSQTLFSMSTRTRTWHARWQMIPSVVGIFGDGALGPCSGRLSWALKENWLLTAIRSGRLPAGLSSNLVVRG